jgi:hypothetical protein
MKKRRKKPVYPDTVEECIDDTLKFRKDTINEINRFKRFLPWRGTVRERRAKLRYLNRQLCGIYGINVRIVFNRQTPSCYKPSLNLIVLEDCSVVTYLHEFAHAMGRNEKGACRWSLNLFKRYFPKSFAGNKQVGHMLVRKRRK